jgi:hypothetical protein
MPDTMIARCTHWRLGQVLVLCALLLLVGCATAQQTPDDIATLSCIEKLQLSDTQVIGSDVRNASVAMVEEYPFLRADRNSVLMGQQVGAALDRDDEVLASELFADWVTQMRALDRTARASEIRNLSVKPVVTVSEQEACANSLAGGLQTDDFAQLSDAVFVPDDYLDFQRVSGLYPLTAFPAYFGYEAWKRDNLQTFTMSEDGLQESGDWLIYAPSGAGAKPANIKAVNISQDKFGRLLPTVAELEALAQQYAPKLRIDTRSDSDLIGLPALQSRDARSEVDLSTPVMFYRLSHTYFGGEWVPQLVYSVWFPERPKVGFLDILAGHLDALIWRVTLNRDGAPIMADSIHGCGCYHMFFPTNGVKRLHAPEDDDIRETAETPAGFLEAETLAQPVLWIDDTSHYLLAVTQDDTQGERSSAIPVVLQPGQDLTSLPLADGTGYASLYDKDGFIPGTDRLERFILWPMGIERPGAMRQWGRHATAFVGRRHFDDPVMLGRYFSFPAPD